MIKRPALAYTVLVLTLALVAVAVFILRSDLGAAAAAAPVFNALIATALVCGVGFVFWRLSLIDSSVQWLQNALRHDAGPAVGLPPPLLAPAAQLLSGLPSKPVAGSAGDVEGALESIAARFEDSREFSRYFGGVVILLGLLGTFWGLFHTVQGVGAVVGGLSIGDGDLPQIFDQLKGGLHKPLTGMATSFSASLFGLASAIILGFIDTVVGASQSNFINSLEDLLKERVVPSAEVPRTKSQASGADPGILLSISESTNSSVLTLCQQLKAHEDVAAQERKTLRELVALLASLADRIELDDQILRKLGESHTSIKPTLDELIESLRTQLPYLQEKWVTHLSRIEAILQQLAEEASRGREQIGSQLRSEMSALQKAISIARQPS